MRITYAHAGHTDEREIRIPKIMFRVETAPKESI